MAKLNTDTKPILLRPPKSRVAALREAALKYGYKSGSQVGVEIIEQYFDYWIELKERDMEAREDQRSRALGKAPAALTQKERRKAS